MKWKKHPDLNYEISSCGVLNLEIISGAENTTHAFRNGLVGTCVPCIVDGKQFHSKREAERQTGIPRYKIA